MFSQKFARKKMKIKTSREKKDINHLESLQDRLHTFITVRVGGGKSLIKGLILTSLFYI